MPNLVESSDLQTAKCSDIVRRAGLYHGYDELAFAFRSGWQCREAQTAAPEEIQLTVLPPNQAASVDKRSFVPLDDFIDDLC
jgi:hypothetical protein